MFARVLLFDASLAALTKSKEFADSWISKEVAKERLSEEQAAALKATLHWTNVEEGGEKLSLLVEAVPESLPIKSAVYKSFYDAELLTSKSILATNTSSISITKLAATTPYPQNFVGLHFMNPVPIMPLVEIIPALQTSPDTLEKAKEIVEIFLKKIHGKSEDRPGFIANRILMPMINEGILCLQDGVSTRNDIDKIMKLGTGVPMGPLTLADFIGLDTCLSIMKVLHKETGDSKYRAAPLLVNYVEAGWLGKKSGRGFYEYSVA